VVLGTQFSLAGVAFGIEKMIWIRQKQCLPCTVCQTTLCLKKNDNDVLRYNFNVHQQILIILADILLNEYAIKW